MSKEETFEILLNEAYGGWGISQKARELYKARSDDKKPVLHHEWRRDPILIQIFRELGDEFNGEYCKAYVTTIKKKYENYYSIFDYDGSESIDIDHKLYNAVHKYEDQIDILNKKIATLEEQVARYKLIKI